MGTSVVVRDHFDVFVTITSIELILDAEIGEVHRLVEVRQVMFPRPLLNLPRIAIGPPITVWAVPVVLLQELLVLVAATIAQAQRSSVSLPFIVKAFSGVFLVLGLTIAVTGVVAGADRVGQGDTSVPALQNFSMGLGGILVAVYGTLILRRKPAALGRWWFLASWPMNFLTPVGLFFFALIVASTLILRKKYAQVFRRSIGS